MIKYSLSEYKKDFNESLIKYQSIYFDAEKSDFITSEISTYRICIDIAHYIDKNYLAIISSYDVESLSFPTPEKFQVISIEYSNINFNTIAKNIITLGNLSTNQSITQRILSFNKIISFLETERAELKTNTKTEVTKKYFKDFFKESISDSKIQAIQNKYKELNGKKMAYVIYLLHKEFEIINYSIKSHIESRKHFVFALIEKENTRIMEGINKCFNPYDITLLTNDYLNDNDYITIKKEIQTILNPI
jgi:hypothetical protein